MNITGDSLNALGTIAEKDVAMPCVDWHERARAQVVMEAFVETGHCEMDWE